MPIFYTADNEELAQSMCAGSGGQYIGRSEALPNLFQWQTHAGLCVKTFSTFQAGGWRGMMVVYDPVTDSFESVLCSSEGAGPDSPTFAMGGQIDAPPELEHKYRRQQFELEEWSRVTAAARANLKGKAVVVVSGHAAKIGTTGECVATRRNRCGRQVAIRRPNGRTFWTNAKHVTEQQPALFAP